MYTKKTGYKLIYFQGLKKYIKDIDIINEDDINIEYLKKTFNVNKKDIICVKFERYHRKGNLDYETMIFYNKKNKKEDKK
jgi:hypothetical protein